MKDGVSPPAMVLTLGFQVHLYTAEYGEQSRITPQQHQSSSGHSLPSAGTLTPRCPATCSQFPSLLCIVPLTVPLCVPTGLKQRHGLWGLMDRGTRRALGDRLRTATGVSSQVPAEVTKKASICHFPNGANGLSSSTPHLSSTSSPSPTTLAFSQKPAGLRLTRG